MVIELNIKVISIVSCICNDTNVYEWECGDGKLKFLQKLVECINLEFYGIYGTKGVDFHYTSSSFYIKATLF